MSELKMGICTYASRTVALPEKDWRVDTEHQAMHLPSLATTDDCEVGEDNGVAEAVRYQHQEFS